MKKYTTLFLLLFLTCQMFAQKSNLSAYSKILLNDVSQYIYVNNSVPKKNFDIPQNIIKEYGILKQNKTYSIGALIKVNNSDLESDFKNLGIHTNSKFGNIWSVTIPLVALKSLEKNTNISYIEIQAPAKKKLNAANIETKLDSVHLGVGFPKGFTGKNVVVGVIDGGFDLTHPTFNSRENGKSRIKKMWDQNDENGAKPNGYNYGSEYIGESGINSKLNAGDGSHGTHVSGIAAGSGILRGSNWSNHGCAPDADLVFVETNGNNSSIADAANYIFNYASSVSKPAVINMSLGEHIGPHDGTSLLDQAFDLMTKDKGRILAGAAGNEGGTKLHIFKKFNKDTIGTFVKFEGSQNPKMGRGKIDLWGDSLVNFELAIFYNNDLFYLGHKINELRDTSYSTSLISNHHDSLLISISIVKNSPLNNKTNILMQLTNTSDSADVLLRFSSKSGNIHVWNHGLNAGADFTSETLNNLVEGDNNCTSGEIGGTANGVITVGAYTTTNQYVNLSGQLVTNISNLGEIASFSSRGPTADGRIKPEITAPGNVIISSVNSHDVDFLPKGNSFRNVADTSIFNGKTYYYGAQQGTSMSTPYVAGVIALMLEADPTLTAAKAKEILMFTARNDDYTGSIPSVGNNIWGRGKINPIGAMKVTLAAAGFTENSIKMNTSVYPNPASNEINISFYSNSYSSHDVEIMDMNGRTVLAQTYQVLRGENSNKINIESLRSGMYIIKISDQYTTGFFKVIINK